VAATHTAVRVTRRPGDGGLQTIEIEVLAREAGLHPDLVRRFVRLGLLEPVGGSARVPLFPRDAPARAWRAPPVCAATWA
jgi:hypothetical protein